MNKFMNVNKNEYISLISDPMISLFTYIPAKWWNFGIFSISKLKPPSTTRPDQSDST